MRMPQHIKMSGFCSAEHSERGRSEAETECLVITYSRIIVRHVVSFCFKSIIMGV